MLTFLHAAPPCLPDQRLLPLRPLCSRASQSDREGAIGFLGHSDQQSKCHLPGACPKPPRPRGEEALSLPFPTQEPRQQHIALQRALPKPGEGLRCRQARCPIGQRGPREQRRRPTPHGTHIPSDAPARPTPAPRRRRTQLHTKDPVWRSRPPERRCQAAGNHGGKRTETDGAGGEGRGWPARDGTGRDGTRRSTRPRPQGPVRAGRPPLPPLPRPAPCSARPPPGLIIQLFSHCSQFITRGGPVKA